MGGVNNPEVDANWRIPESLWEHVEPLLPPEAQGRETPCLGAAMYGRCILRAAHRLPIEGFAPMLRTGQHGA